MKKTLLLLASAALLLVGCAKEQITENTGEGLQTVSFTIGIESNTTKAVLDGDGAAANINHWIMQVIDTDGDVYNYQELNKKTDLTQTFNVPLIKGQTYQVLFWADHITYVDGGDDIKHYDTSDLTNVKLINVTTYNANLDERDAFSAVVPNFSTTVATQQNITLKRPFAQLNVVFTDLNNLYTTMGNDTEYGKFKPVTFVAKAKVPTTFDVLTQAADAPAETALEMKAATNYKDNYAAHGEKATLYMDYILASAASKDVVDIDFSFVSKGVTIAHNFAAVPLQRNYRTNILGDLMSANAKWVVTVDPAWDSLNDGSKDYNVNYYEPSSITDAQNYIANNDNQKAKTVDLSKYTVTTGDFDPNADDKTIKFELKTTSPADMVNFTLPAIPADVISAGCTGWKITHETGYPTDNVNVTAPEGTIVTIDAPRSHVTLNGSVYNQVTATTGPSTLVVPAGVTIDNLIVKKGAVEIHGIVTNLTVDPAPIADTDPVQYEKVVFRACEGLSASVFEKIYNESEHINYIDPMYAYKQVDGKYNIYKLPVVAMIGTVEYPSLAAAIAAVPANNTQLVTINVMSDVVLKKADALDINALDINKNNVVIDGQYHTIALDENDPELAQYLADGTNGTYGKFQMIKVSGNDVTLKNLTLDCKNYRGASLATTNGGKNASYENIVYKGLGSGHYYGTAGGDGTLKFKNCTFETHGYAIHTAECQSVLEVSDCEIHGWVSYGDKTKSATFTNTHFYSTEDAKNGVLATIRPYCATTITNCTFSKEYLIKYKFDGLTVRSNVVVSLKDCSVEEGELCDIANITCPDDPWIDGGVIAIDATGNATDGFTAGTFVAKQASDIKVAGLNEVVPVEGKENVYSIAPKQFAETTVAYCNGVEYETLQAAFDAVPDGVETTVTLVADAKQATIGDKNNIGGKTVILNLNGHSITGHMRGISTLTNTASLEGATLVNYANLTINGEGTIGDLEGEYHHNALVNMSDGTNLTINGGTFVAKSCCVYHYSASSEANTASINVNGGYFKAYENAATNKYVFGIGGQSGQTLTFNYGNAIAEASVEGAKGIYCSLAGTTINVHSGSITANINAIYLNMGQNVTINIDGGKLETLDSEGHANNYMSYGSYVGSSLPIYASAFGSKNIVCNISGGTFVYPYYSWQLSGTIPATWERVINAGAGITSNVANANINASLTGGTYSTNQMLSDITKTQSAASGIVAEGYTCIQNDNGTWTVVAEN